MSDTFIQQQNRLRQRRKQKNLDFAKGSVFSGFVTIDHDGDNEKVGLSYHAGQATIPTLHPYIGADSWIRTGAEAGQPMLAAQRPDSEVPDLLAYVGQDNGVRVDAYNAGVGLYRPLAPGEIEMHSKGLAQTHYSRRPVLEQRGGVVRDWLDQDRLEAGARSPTHVRHLHGKRSGVMGDEERFGVVTRPTSPTETKYIRSSRIIDPVFGAIYAASAATAGVVAQPGPWAKEHTRIIKTGAITPEKLIDVREGDVIDDYGDVMNLSKTGKPLRFKGEWFTEGLLGGALYVGVDRDGNFSVRAPDDATSGGDVAIPAGDLLIEVGANHTVQVQTDYALSTTEGNATIEAQTGYTVTVADGSIVLSPSVQLDVGQADEPAVLGNQLIDLLGQFLDLFGQHFHTGNMGAPTPLDPGGVSQAAQLKANFVDNKQIVSDYINFSKSP